MKLSTIQIQYDKEKLSAIRHYMKDESKLEADMEARLQELYVKYVPVKIRNGVSNQGTMMENSD